MTKIVSSIPPIGLNLNKNGIDIVQRLGESSIRNAILGILTGENIRSLTEGLTRRRLTISTAALLSTYVNAANNIKNFTEELPHIVLNELINTKISAEQKFYLQWLIGLTGKSIQNVLRGSDENLKKYIAELDNILTTTKLDLGKELGELSGKITIGNSSILLDWLVISRIFTAIGSQTLTIRGAEKSMYGKLFEKLILGTVLSILGFKFVKKEDTTLKNKIFWLSDRDNKRESDATLIIKPGQGIRFDIGFIGPGNTEISLDKVSRFENSMLYNTQQYYMKTIILIDRIGEKSHIQDMAEKINGKIIQMSMSNWVKDLAREIERIVPGFRNPLIQKNEDTYRNFLEESIKKIDLKLFIK